MLKGVYIKQSVESQNLCIILIHAYILHMFIYCNTPASISADGLNIFMLFWMKGCVWYVSETSLGL